MRESMNQQSTLKARQHIAYIGPFPCCVTGFYALRDHMKKLEMPAGINLNVNTK